MLCVQGVPGSEGSAGEDGEDGARGANGNLGFPGPPGLDVRRRGEGEGAVHYLYMKKTSLQPA
jgi:hypothetical protein